jgi:hypothetical protein
VLGKKNTIGLYDCLEGRFQIMEKFPFIVGCLGNADWQVPCSDEWEGACMIKKMGNHFRIVPNKKGDERLLVNGGPFTEPFTVEEEEVCALQFTGYPLVVFVGRDPKSWADQIQKGQWVLTNGRSGMEFGQCGRYEVIDKIRESGADVAECAIKPMGLDVPFWVVHLLDFLQLEEEEEEEEAIYEEEIVVDPDRGEFTCPICWLKFDRSDVLSIATHEDLRGDRKLGEDAMLRFIPTEFNSKGQAMDAMGLPTTDVACPHCHHKLPPGFMDVTHHIFSIVGAPSAGKSYYLSVLVRQLQRTMFREFGIAFRDADPAYNAILNSMKNRLFAGTDPAEAMLIKTQLEGEMYERLERHDRMVALPKPFVFSLSDPRGGGHDCSIIFYDNAGEHFEPGIANEESPGTLHVASSSGIFFLFDPIASPEFRRRLRGHEDPQFALDKKGKRLDQQDIIMAELEVRVKQNRNISIADKIDVPLAVMIGKCDILKDQLDWERIQWPIKDKKLIQEIIDSNSEILRDYMIDMHPGIVANAETLSRNVRYFPVSAFGHSPTTYKNGDQEFIAPDPDKLDPVMVEVPTLWAISQVEPDLIPVPEPV